MAEGKIFISYRRADASGYAGRLYDHLSDHFGADEVPKHGTDGRYAHFHPQI